MFALEKKVLIVDDMRMARLMVRKELIEIGFKDIVEATNGEDAWKVLNENIDISLIISDWNMPVLTGLEFLKRLRADHRFTLIPFIMVTAESEEGQVQAAYHSGASGYIVKPYNSDIFRAKLEYTDRKLKSV